LGDTKLRDRSTTLFIRNEPNGLGQHPVSAAIIHAAMIEGLLEEFTDPSDK
jgi:hypothetical protein